MVLRKRSKKLYFFPFVSTYRQVCPWYQLLPWATLWLHRLSAFLTFGCLSRRLSFSQAWALNALLLFRRRVARPDATVFFSLAFYFIGHNQLYRSPAASILAWLRQLRGALSLSKPLSNRRSENAQTVVVLAHQFAFTNESE